jgi:hypothetical protein
VLDESVAEGMARERKLEELVRELVKFTGHDKACNELRQDELPVDTAVKLECTCGIRRLYAKVDELID